MNLRREKQGKRKGMEEERKGRKGTRNGLEKTLLK